MVVNKKKNIKHNQQCQKNYYPARWKQLNADKKYRVRITNKNVKFRINGYGQQKEQTFTNDDYD